MSAKTDELIDELIDETQEMGMEYGALEAYECHGRILEEKKAELKAEIMRLENKIIIAIDALEEAQGDWSAVEIAWCPVDIAAMKRIADDLREAADEKA